MRLPPAICHIGIVGAVVRPAGFRIARDLLAIVPASIGGKARVALGPRMHLGDLQPVGDRHRLREDVGAADHHDLSGDTPQRIAARDRERVRRTTS